MSTSLEKKRKMRVLSSLIFYSSNVKKTPNLQKAYCWGNFDPIGTGMVISEHNFLMYVFFKLDEGSVDLLTFLSEPMGGEIACISLAVLQQGGGWVLSSRTTHSLLPKERVSILDLKSHEARCSVSAARPAPLALATNFSIMSCHAAEELPVYSSCLQQRESKMIVVEG